MTVYVESETIKKLKHHMLGFKVIDIYMHSDVKEGGLTFLIEKGGIEKEIALGYNELDEWVEFVNEEI